MSHIIIVGAGIVGLSCAWAAQKEGWDVTIIDKDFYGDRTSHGNAGGLGISESLPLTLSGLGLKPFKWLADPLGPLSIRWQYAPRLIPWYLHLLKVGKSSNYMRIANALSSLNQRAIADFKDMIEDIGAANELHHTGALLVYETSEAYDADQESLSLKRKLGVRMRDVSLDELRELEPGLAPVFKHALMYEDWHSVNDPKVIVELLRAAVLARGAKLTQATAESIQTGPETATVILSTGATVEGDKILVANGAWAPLLAKTVGDNLLIESERGYNTTLPASRKLLNREVIFAERMFVATPLEIGLRIGGAAEFAGLSAPANFQRSRALYDLSKKYLLNVDSSGALEWMGHRPSTPDSLPVIGKSSKSASIVYACGHGHLGLTQSATTAKLVASIITDRKPEVDVYPFRPDRF